MSTRIKFLVGLVAFNFVLRLMPYVLTAYSQNIDPTVIFYPWNFMPLTAICLYAGAYITDRRWAIALPLLAVLLSDMGIWAVTGHFAWAFPSDRWSAYFCYMIVVFMGQGLNARAWPKRAVDAFSRGIIAEALFFVVTNFAYFLVQTDHPMSPAGLAACYAAAIPFAGKSFASTAFYSVLLFSPLAIRASGESRETQPSVQSVLTR
jgi:hypothetical protein